MGELAFTALLPQAVGFGGFEPLLERRVEAPLHPLPWPGTQAGEEVRFSVGKYHVLNPVTSQARGLLLLVAQSLGGAQGFKRKLMG